MDRSEEPYGPRWPGSGGGRQPRRHGSWRHGPWGHGPPHWWPQDEPWPPRRPPGAASRHRFRRRFLFTALGLVAMVMLAMAVLGFLFGSWERRWDDGPRQGEENDRGPGGLIVLVGGVGAVGAVATALAYRRLSRPVGDLLEAAGQVASGDYQVQVRPEGPRELRLFTQTFNRMAAELAATDQQRRQFLADVTHELRTPLAVLQSEVEAQLDGIHPRDDAHLGSLLEEIQRLGRLVADLHTVAVAEAGHMVLHRERIRLGALLTEAVDAHAAVARSDDVQVALVPGADARPLPEVDADPVRLRQVLDNLLANAVRYTPAGGEVRVHAVAESGAEPDATLVRVTITDSGPGFAPEQLDQVFERFTRSADAGGSGLGLRIARDLVEAHGGSIAVANDPSTGGGAVSFVLPAVPVVA